jgi:hypothetical protein
MKLPKNLGMLLLAIWLILLGLVWLAGLSFVYRDVIMGLIALVAGILLLIGK